ncbi:MAG TPA: folylpolyglutamate synthase/dihydrofolate synthase family protein [Thermoanaerobaculia bacterium]|nr:folylpolyglutamate synthase/dihydrofolate synthase family protein [Thermoanaerobaculia bacterium]HUM29734.1 folylpolyglutamate synthase/dihydrofolate synthase family protein [Thermoanaerobaculia bacterium]HXK67034.1 folylpolyglutamate synthase/dihydrofolate synthase family protein [Thermoanaerobaculia bacterium]
MDVDGFLESLKPSEMTLGLERVRSLVERLPIQSHSNNILVAGTNGKGSTSAFLASILETLSGSTGLFTSPHLLSVHERIRVSGTPIDEKTFAALVEEIASVLPSMDSPPTYFEFLTAAAALHFQRSETRFNVFEVGLGGRLDATNILTGPVSIITRIAHDHMHLLGRTLEQIAGEKAGIIKPGQTVVVTPQRAPVLRQLREIAHTVGAEIVESSRLVRIRPLHMDPDGMVLEAKIHGTWTPFHTSLTGPHQIENLAAALSASTLLDHPTAEALQIAVAHTRWPGRLETFRLGNRRLIIDGAHNPSGIRALGAYLDRVQLPRPVELIFGSVTQKKPRQSLQILSPRVDRIRLVPIISTPRSWTEAMMHRTASSITSRIPVTLERNLSDALTGASGSPTTLVSGSLYLVSEVMQWLNRSPWQLTTRALP